MTNKNKTNVEKTRSSLGFSSSSELSVAWSKTGAAAVLVVSVSPVSAVTTSVVHRLLRLVLIIVNSSLALHLFIVYRVPLWFTDRGYIQNFLKIIRYNCL